MYSPDQTIRSPMPQQPAAVPREGPIPMPPADAAGVSPGLAMQQGPQFAPFREHLMQGIAQLTPYDRELLRMLMSKPQFVALFARLLGSEFTDIIQRNAELARQAGQGMGTRQSQPQMATAPQPAAAIGGGLEAITARP